MVIVAAAAVAAASALAQWYNSEQARKASKEQLAAAAALWEKLQSPDFDTSDITPDEFKVVAQYVPEAALTIKEADPEIIKRTADMDQGRSARMGALQKFRQVAESGFDPAFESNMQSAWRSAAADAHSRAATVASDFAQRGQSGSGLEAVLQAQAGDTAGDRAAMMSQDAAARAYQNKLNAYLKAADLGEGIEQSDVQFQSKNADIINALNARVANRAQDVEMANTGARNDAMRYNIANAQDVSNRSTASRNAAKFSNRENRNDMAQRTFQNNATITAGRAGMTPQIVAQNNQSAADNNQAIQGVTNAGIGALGYQQDANRATAAQIRQDDREQYKQTGQWMTPEERKKREEFYQDEL